MEDSDTATTIPGAFAVNIDKNCEAKTVVPFDPTIDCTIDVSAPAGNTGPINNCSIEDASFGGVIASGFSLNPGQAWPTEDVSRAVTNQDVIDMVVENTATVTCSSQQDVDNVFNSDNAFANIFEVGATIEDVCTPDTQFSPGTITWTITICNTGPFDKGDATDLVINTNGEITKDAVFFDGAPEKDIVNFSLEAGACLIVDVVRDALDDGTYKDTISGSASHQAGSFDLMAMASCVVETPGENGCTPGYWKQNFDNWQASAWTVESANPLVSSVFATSSSDLNGDGDDDTLRDALSYKGGKGAEGAERNLLRHAVAAKLNIENGNVAYPIGSVDDLKTAVNAAIASGERGTMNDLKNELDEFNNLGCNINARGDPE